MKISTILDHIDSGHMALPEFQRGYVWNRDQVRGLFDSLYRKHPVGGLLVWATESSGASYRGDGSLASGIVKLLLDGQQRMTSLYGVIRGKPPKFFDGNKQAFMGLYFNIDTEQFNFYQQQKMSGDPLWIDVSDLMKKGTGGLGTYITALSAVPAHAPRVGDYVGRLSNLLGITEIELHVEEVTGKDKNLDVVVDIFNKVNSGGTKLSKGDLALAKISADWPAARDSMKANIKEWKDAGYDFSLDWHLRSISTTLTGEAKFQFLDACTADQIRSGLKSSKKNIDACLNMIGGRLGLDHEQVFFGRYAVPVMVRYLDKTKTTLNEIDRDKLLFWYAQAGMWGRFSSTVESYIDQDLAALEGPDGGLDKLLETLRLWHGGLRVEPGNFGGWSLGARFYPVLYMVTRMSQARDLGTGLPLKANLLGKMSKLEVHHIFPKAQLYKFKSKKYTKSEVNALGNFCFLTKDSNLEILDRLPREYFPEVEAAHPGVLASQWIPMDPRLWELENFGEFLKARQELLAAEVNRQMESLLHGDKRWLDDSARRAPQERAVPGSISSAEEEAALDDVNEWVEERGLAAGELSCELVDETSGTVKAILDLAWPDGLQRELSEPVALLLNETQDVIAMANEAGYRCFQSPETFRRYVEAEILGM